MGQVHWTGSALDDLDDIAEFVVKDFLADRSMNRLTKSRR
jgi:hypothetical protein